MRWRIDSYATAMGGGKPRRHEKLGMVMRKLSSCGLLLLMLAWASAALAGQFTGAWAAGDQNEKWVVVFNDNGTFTRQVTKPGQPVYNEQGTYRIQGNQMFVHAQGEPQGYYLQFRFTDANTLELFEDGELLARMVRQGGSAPPVTRGDPNQAKAYAQKGVEFAKQQKYEQALPYFQKAAELDPAYVGAFQMMGMTLRELKRYDQALAAYNKAIQLAPQAGILYYGRAVTHAMLNQGEQALADAEKAVRLSPQDEKAKELRDMIRRNLAKRQQPQTQGKGYQLRGNTIVIDPNAPSGTVSKALQEQQRRQQQQ